MPPKPYGLSPKTLITSAKGLYLVIRRSAESTFWPGKWDLAGGKQDPGESVDQTAIREAREETGLEITVTGYIGSSAVELPHVHVVFLVFNAEVIGGEFKLSQEHEAFRWVDDAELSKVDFSEPITKALRPFTGR